MKPAFFGARVRRREDPRFLTGRGCFVDDIVLPGMLHAAFVRSPHARARIRSIEVDAARRSPGVAAVFTGRDLLEAGLVFEGEAMYGYRMPVLAWEEVRYVGEPVALVVADSRYRAEDAALSVKVDYQPERPVLDMEEALRDEVRIHRGQSNIFYHKEFTSDGFDEFWRRAERRLQARFRTERQTAASIETRGAIAVWEPGSRRAILYLSSQSPHTVRSELARLFGWPEVQLRVVAPDVGGAFGMKAAIYPEEVAVLFAATRLHRPVKWIADRRESLLADVHARDDLHEVEVAFDGDGTIWAIRDHLVADGGAYPAFPFSGAVGETSLAARILTGPYRIPAVSYRIDCVLTDKTPLGAYRGVWGPIATFVQEGIVTRVARAVGLDPVEVRRRNLIRAEDFPYQTPTGLVYDPGSYAEAMEAALHHFGYQAFRREQVSLRQEGRLVGVGVSVFVEPSAFAGSEAGEVPYESCLLRMEPSGQVIAALGLGPSGQGHETTIAQVIADELGIAPEAVVVLHGDTDTVPYGGGTGGSRSAVTGGGAARRAARRVREKILRIAAHLLEADPGDLVLEGGRVHVHGVPARSLALEEVAYAAYLRTGELPPDLEPGLEALARYAPPAEMTFSNGCHVALVEVDRLSGQVRVLRYVVANDCGRLINPTIVEGQIQGGVAQGVGSAFLEWLHYDADGQLLTTTLADYLLPTAPDVPNIEILHLETPSANEGGVKGMAEGSLIASPAALALAVQDALEPLGVEVGTLPLTPDRVLRLMGELSEDG